MQSRLNTYPRRDTEKSPPHLLLLLFSPSHFTAGLHFSIIARATLPPSAPECRLCLPAVSFCLFLLCSLPTIKGAARIESEDLGLCLCGGRCVRFFAVVTASRSRSISFSHHRHPTTIHAGAVRSPPGPDPETTLIHGCAPWACQVDELAYNIFKRFSSPSVQCHKYMCKCKNGFVSPKWLNLPNMMRCSSSPSPIRTPELAKK